MKNFSHLSLARVKTFATSAMQSKGFRTVLSGLVLGLFAAGTAQAGQCIIPAEQGNWKNSDVNTRGVTRIEFEMECRDAGETVCDGNGICRTTSAVKPHYFVKVAGSCSPTDCQWGREEGTKNGDWFVFNYDPGFATKDVWVRTYSQWPGWMRVWVSTNYRDNREDRTDDYWFRPE